MQGLAGGPSSVFAAFCDEFVPSEWTASCDEFVPAEWTSGLEASFAEWTASWYTTSIHTRVNGAKVCNSQPQARPGKPCVWKM